MSKIRCQRVLDVYRPVSLIVGTAATLTLQCNGGILEYLLEQRVASTDTTHLCLC